MSESSIWQKPISVALLNEQNKNTVNEHLGIEFTSVDSHSLSARLSVTQQTKQPFGLLHGGVNVVLAETLGSAAAYFAAAEGYIGVGLDINANHLRGVKDGYVQGVATALHLGRTTQVWEVKIHDDQGRLSCISRLTVALIKHS